MTKKNILKQAAAYPHMVWAVIFIVAPLLFVAYYAFTDKEGVFTFANIGRLAQLTYLEVFLRSVCFAFLATVICFVIAYPVAYFISRTSPSAQKILVMLVMLPQWLNFLIRTYSWMAILEDTGIINNVLGIFGWEFHMINTPGAVILGMVYNFLPFMVLPIYNALVKLDPDVINAAKDLGANGIQTFIKVIFPLTLPGVISGIMMVFIPALTTFVISNLLGGSKILLIGNIIEQEFTQASNWNLGSGLSLVMMIFIIISMAASAIFDKDGEGSLF